MINEQDTVFEELRDALAVRPSSSFKTRVRATIESQRSAGSLRHDLIWQLAAVGFLMLAAAGPFVFRASMKLVPSNAVAAVSLDSTALPSRSAEPALVLHSRKATQDVARAAHRRPNRPGVARDVKVLSNQGAVLNRIWMRALRDSQSTHLVEIALEVKAVDPAARLTISPITVEPIVVRDIGDGSSSNRSKQ